MPRSTRRTIAENAIALYLVQFAGYIFPLILIPYLARTLHPAALGKVAFSQSFAWWSGMVIEFGFSLSASREVAQGKGDREQLSKIFASVFTIKGTLALVVIASAIIARYSIPIFRDSPTLVWAALWIALMQGANVGWFFMGLERMRVLALFDLAAKCASLVGVLLVVHGPQDAWKFLVLQGVANAIPSFGGIFVALRYVSIRRPRMAHMLRSLGQSWPIFLVNSIISFYGTANTMILGTMRSVVMVGYYAGSEKSVRPFCNLFGPISQSLYPRSNALVATRPREAARLSFYALLLMVGAGLIIGVVVSLSAPLIVHVVLGKEYAPSIPVIRVLAFLIPLTGAGFALGQQCMLPLGLEKAFVRTVMVSAVVDITAAIILAPRLGALGQAIAILCAESTTIAGNYIYLMRKGLAPHQWRQRPLTSGETTAA